MLTYEVRVHPVGKFPQEWYVYVPAFGRGVFVRDWKDVEPAGRGLIQGCGGAANKFDIEITR